MYDNMGGHAGGPRPPLNPQANPFGNAFGAGSGLIRGGLGAYGEKIFESSSEYVQSNISRYFSDPQYYFQVNDQYVRNKLKVVLFPFLHRGHWTRITEPVGGRLSYKPPLYDINAPDLYIPLMAFGTYVVLAGIMLGLSGKFSPEALSLQFTKGLLGWFFQVLLFKMSLYSLGSGEAPLLDIVAYAGYAFTGMCVAVLGRLMWSYSYYFVMPWTCLCMGIFLVKTMKRVLFAEPLVLYNIRMDFIHPLQNGGSMLGGLGATIAEGMAFGTGTAMAHRAVEAVMGPRVIQHEAVVSGSTATVSTTTLSNANVLESCNTHSKAFQDCLNSYGSDISKCQFYMDMLSEC